MAELTKLGAAVEEGRDYCIITPPAGGAAGVKPSVDIETYDDHRMAMAFALAAAAGVPVNILDPGCTRKTFPTYFKVRFMHGRIFFRVLLDLVAGGISASSH